MTNEDYIKAEVARRIKNDPNTKKIDYKFALAMVSLLATFALEWYFILHDKVN